MCGTDDVETSYKHFKAFFETFSQVDQLVKVDK
jgi:aspartyl aminopeptidase